MFGVNLGKSSGHGAYGMYIYIYMHLCVYTRIESGFVYSFFRHKHYEDFLPDSQRASTGDFYRRNWEKNYRKDLKKIDPPGLFSKPRMTSLSLSFVLHVSTKIAWNGKKAVITQFDQLSLTKMQIEPA